MAEEKKTCNRCSGSGQIPCPSCSGSGTRSLNEGHFSKIVNCATCSGRGNVTCGGCGGSGQK